MRHRSEINSPKLVWFRTKRYGFGWYPVSWQGWLVSFIWVAVYAGLISTLNLRLNFSWQASVISVLLAIPLVGLLVLIARKTGEKSTWRWGHSQPQDEGTSRLK